MRRNLQQWLTDYGATHQNKTNKRIHFICVPLILFSILGLLWSLPVPAVLAAIPFFNWAMVLIVVSMLFYLSLSISLSIGMLLMLVLFYYVFEAYIAYGFTELWVLSLVLFVLAWVGQFIGHAIEGKKPSFFEDIKFLLIGPLWILGFVYQKLSIPYGGDV